MPVRQRDVMRLHRLHIDILQDDLRILLPKHGSDPYKPVLSRSVSEGLHHTKLLSVSLPALSYHSRSFLQNVRSIYIVIRYLLLQSIPMIRIGSHKWLKAPNRTASTKITGQKKNSPRPNRNFVVPHARRIPKDMTPIRSIAINMISNMFIPPFPQQLSCFHAFILSLSFETTM